MTMYTGNCGWYLPQYEFHSGRTHVGNFSSLEPFMVTEQKDCTWSPTRHEEVFEFSLAVPEAQTPLNSWELMKLQPDKEYL